MLALSSNETNSNGISAFIKTVKGLLFIASDVMVNAEISDKFDLGVI